MSGGTGSLIIKPSAARLTRDTEFLGKMDPYCVVKMGSQKQRTATHSSAGKFPSWRDSIVFRRSHEDMVTFEVWDADTASSDDLVGEGNLPIHSILTSGNFNDWVNLTYKGKSAGQLRVDIQWVPDQGANGHNPGQHQPYQQVPQQSPITPTLIIQQLPGYLANAYPPQYAAPYAGPPAGYAPAPAYASPYGQYADPNLYLTPQAMQNVPGYSYPYPQQPQGYPQGYPGYPQGYYYPPR